MDVLIVIPAMSAEAGAETSLFEVMPHLLASGFHLRVAVLTHHQGLVAELERLDLPVHDLSGRTLVGRAMALRTLIDRTDPDLVHATLFQASLPTQLASLGRRRPILVTWASTPVDPRAEGRTPWKVRLVELSDALMGRASRSRFHAVTPGVARSKGTALRVDPARVRVAERGRDPERFGAADPDARRRTRSELGLADGDVAVLAVGRHEPEKGYADLLPAFDEVAAGNAHVRLLVAGRTGTATAWIEALAAGLAAADRVTLLGHRSDVPDLLRAADVMVCASTREGAAGAVIEAMASGTPIVSVRLVGLEGIVEDGVNAIVVEREQLAAGIRRAIDDLASAADLADRATATFAERFTLSGSASALGEVYRWAAGPE